jgi:hypothetical protein
MDAAKPAASGSNESQAATVLPSRYGVAFAQTESKPTYRQLGTIPKSGAPRDKACPKPLLSKGRDCKIVAGNQFGGVVLNCAVRSGSGALNLNLNLYLFS